MAELSTIERSVPSTAFTWEPVPTPPRRRWPWVFVPGVLFLSVLLASFNVMLPYYRLAPGSARSINDLVTVPADQRYPPKGSFMLTTVSLGQTRAIDAFLGWLDDDVDVVPQDRIVPPNTTGQQYLELARLDMEQSKQKAIVVAVRRLGHPVVETGEGAIVVFVVPDLPAAGTVEAGDVIVAVDGKAVATSTAAVAAIRARRAGDTITFEVRPGGRDGPTRTVQITSQEQPEAPGQPLVGFQLRTRKQHFDLPFPVSIDSQNIGGPSAGLAFTLAVLDALTPGELTGGRQVAVTGEINVDGSVGEIGGVAQKAAAVEASGARVFLVPAAEAGIARAHVSKAVTVIGVATLEDAIAALGKIGGDTAALGRAGQAAQG